jgi:hypothetical protein
MRQLYPELLFENFINDESNCGASNLYTAEFTVEFARKTMRKLAIR